MQKPGKPSVHHPHWWRTSMSILMIIYFGGNTHFPCFFVNPVAVFRHYVPVIESMCHQKRCFHRGHMVEIIPLSPKFVVFYCNTINTLGHLDIVVYSIYNCTNGLENITYQIIY